MSILPQAVSTIATSAISLSWTKTSTDPNFDDVILTDETTNSHVEAYQSGLASKVNQVFYDVATITGNLTTYNLQSLSKTLFGNTITTSFSGVNVLLVENLATGVGTANDASLIVTASGTSAWTTPWNGGSGNVIVPNQSCMYISSYNGAGFVVDGTHQNLTLARKGTATSGYDYRIALVGSG